MGRAEEFGADGQLMLRRMTMLRGIITTKDVLAHARLIAREFGFSALWRCALAVLLRRRTTFLECVRIIEPRGETP